MVQRTDRYGDIVEGEPDERVVNTRPFGKPLLLIFVQNRWELMERIGTLKGVLYCKKERLKNLINHCYHIIIYVPTKEIVEFVGRLDNISQDVETREEPRAIVAIDLLGKNIRSLDIPFKLDFGDKSDDFIFEYLKEFLRIE
ncbi:hypothetical protein LCGC14_0909520 [marine sediment metagenome]|uniref:Uncharacterized protein n=1 Tax=marine sediment metagenome TaxID=412755 RepID=A0A0F9RCX5_9ZZZZ